MDKEFSERLEKLLKKMNINIKKEQINKFYEYMKLILEWNKKINLTAIVEKDDIIMKHFVDSLTILKYINKNSLVVDIGTGAGFPGVPLAIMDETTEFILVDSLNKRINFLNEVKKEIKLNNIKNIHSRAEDFGREEKNREKFDFAVSRAVANLTVLVEYLLPLIKVGGQVICMKGNQIEEELNQSIFAINKLGGEVIEKEEFYLPETDIKRNIIIIEKVKETPREYPRKSGVPSKQPLK